MKQLIARIDDDLHAQFKAAVALSGEKMTDIIEGFLRQYIADKNATLMTALSSREFPMNPPLVAPDAAEELAKLLREAAAV